MLTYATLFAIAFLVTFLLTPVVRGAARRAGAFDVPDGRRKLHAGPIPRLGGIAVVAGFYLSLFAVLRLVGDAAPAGAASLALGMVVPVLFILSIGVVDDLWSVRPAVKLAFQMAAGLWVYYVLGIRIEFLANPLGGESMLGALSLPATLVWIVLVTNAFNIVDGMDGLAAGVSLIASLCMFVVSLQLHNAQVALIAAPLAGALLGFLRYNFNPASIFLGDAGSLFLGFQLAVLSVVGSQKSSTAITIVSPLLMLALPLLETGVSMMRRYIRGEPIMQADRGHIHHQLIRMGLTPRRAVLLLYLGSAVFGLTSLFVVQRDGVPVGVIAVVLAIVVWTALQRLGYAEFAEINSMLKRVFLYQRRVIQHNLFLRKLGEDLREAASLDSACDLLSNAAEQLGFSHVTLRCGRPGSLVPAIEGSQAMPDMQRHTVMSVALAGQTGEVGEVILARARKAEPLHSALPVLIETITSSLPSIVEQTLLEDESLSRDAARLIKVYPQADGYRRRHNARVLAAAPPAIPRTVAMRPAAAAARVVDTAMLSSQPCPQCDALALARSHSRTFAERVRKVVARKRLHRCAECGWRGWVFVLIPLEEDEPRVSPPVPDLTSLDQGFGRTQPMRVAL
jgi:UDP-GlcNAc:undecaprenyl-phosphate GlcNAc-1-phosphate transferase